MVGIRVVEEGSLVVGEDILVIAAGRLAELEGSLAKQGELEGMLEELRGMLGELEGKQEELGGMLEEQLGRTLVGLALAVDTWVGAVGTLVVGPFKYMLIPFALPLQASYVAAWQAEELRLAVCLPRLILALA